MYQYFYFMISFFLGLFVRGKKNRPILCYLHHSTLYTDLPHPAPGSSTVNTMTNQPSFFHDLPNLTQVLYPVPQSSLTTMSVLHLNSRLPPHLQPSTGPFQATFTTQFNTQISYIFPWVQPGEHPRAPHPHLSTTYQIQPGSHNLVWPSLPSLQRSSSLPVIPNCTHYIQPFHSVTHTSDFEHKPPLTT